MARKCSHCGNKGHNSRTCTNPRSSVGSVGLKLFGVQLHIASPPLKKSYSMDCLSSHYLASPSSSPSSLSNSLVSIDEATERASNGYLSEDLMERAQERKKGELLLCLYFSTCALSDALFLSRMKVGVNIVKALAITYGS